MKGRALAATLMLWFVALASFAEQTQNAAPALVAASPKGTFKIESETKPAPDPDQGTDFADYIVSLTDPKKREPLHEHADITHVEYFVSPDEKWIFGNARYGHKMAGGLIFRHQADLKFEPLKDRDFEKMTWRFFAKEEKIDPKEVPYFDSKEGIIDFVAWSPDSARLLVDLRVEIGGNRQRGVYKWYLYFNTRTQQLEVTDYLRRLNKDAWKRWNNSGAVFPEAASAEPLDKLPPEGDLRKRYQDGDGRMNKTYSEVLAKIDTEQQKNLRDDQRNWIKTRDAGAAFYKRAGDKSAAECRYWQYMLDSTEARIAAVTRYAQ